jgi:hypothetical protein
MIYSAENGDRGDVFVDGTEIKFVLSVDTDKREVIKMVHPTRIENGEVVTEVVTGEKVEFVRH